jgi:hypothetical protein
LSKSDHNNIYLEKEEKWSSLELLLEYLPNNLFALKLIYRWEGGLLGCIFSPFGPVRVWGERIWLFFSMGVGLIGEK